MRTKRFLLALLLCCVGLITQAANRADDFSYTTYSGSNGKTYVKITRYLGTSKDVVIPETINGDSVKEIGVGAFTGASFNDWDTGTAYSPIDAKIASVVVPNSVTAIDNFAFYQQSELVTVKLGNSVSSIGDYVFQYDDALSEISLPNSLHSVGSHFLCHCPGLTTLVIPADLTEIGDYFLHGCKNLKTVYLMGTNQKKLGKGAFISQVSSGEEQVSGCTFYVANQDMKDWYENADNWKYAGENNSDIYSDDQGYYQNGYNGTDKNKYAVMPENARTYTNKWATICLPYDVADVKQEFGDNAKVAVLTSAELLSTSTSTTKKYKMHFTILTTNKIEANKCIFRSMFPHLFGA